MKKFCLLLFSLLPAVAQEPFSVSDPAFIGRQSSLRTNLVSFWALNEKDGLRYDCIGSNHLYPTNNPLWVYAKYGPAVEISYYQTNFLSVTNATLQAGTSNITISAWVWLGYTNDSNGTVFLSKYTSDAGKREYQLSYLPSVNRLRFTVSSDGTTVVGVNADDFGDANLYTWYHIVAWTDGTKANISVNNGTTSQTNFSGAVNSFTNPFRIGGNNNSSQQVSGCRVQNVGFWRRVLTANERTLLYNYGLGATAPFFRQSSAIPSYLTYSFTPTRQGLISSFGATDMSDSTAWKAYIVTNIQLALAAKLDTVALHTFSGCISNTPSRPETAAGSDYLTYFIAACVSNNIKPFIQYSISADKWTTFCPEPTNWVQANSSNVPFDGTLCPSYQAMRDAEASILTNFFIKFPGLAGIHLDEPGVAVGACYCSSCDAFFTANPGISRTTQYAAWTTIIISNVYNYCVANNKTLISNGAYGAPGVMDDLSRGRGERLWSQGTPMIHAYSPQCYVNGTNFFAGIAGDSTSLIRPTLCIPIIGIVWSGGNNTTSRIVNQIHMLPGVAGVCGFNLFSVQDMDTTMATAIGATTEFQAGGAFAVRTTDTGDTRVTDTGDIRVVDM